MLDLMRRQKRLKLILWVVIAGLALGMLLFFVPGVDMGSVETTNTIASVDGKDIPVRAFSSLYRRTVERISSGSRGKVDLETLKAMGVPNQVLDDLIKSEVIRSLAERMGIGITENEIRRAVETNPNFLDNGKFIGLERYKELLAQNNYSVSDFEADIARISLAGKLHAVITASIEVSERELRDAYARGSQKTQVDYVLLKKDDFTKRVKPTPSDLQSYFGANKDSYRIKEKRRAQYLLVPISPFLPSIKITDQEIASEWGKRSHEEMVEAAHILLLVKEPSQDAAVKQQAEKVLKLAKAGEDFAGLARKFSEDTGSSSQGGYLGPFSKGQMVPEFEQAAFSLKSGETSGLVRTQYGYHIIKVLRHETPTLESSRAELTAAILQRKSQDMAKQKAEEIAAAALKQKDLKLAAANLGIVSEVRETGLFQNEDNPFERGISEALRDEIFAMKEINTIGKAVEHPMGYAVPKLLEVQMPRPGTFAEFQAQIEKDYIEYKAKELVQAEAARLSEEARKQANLEKAAKAFGWSVKKSQEFTISGTPDPEIGANTPFNKAAFDLEPGAVSTPQPVLDNVAVFQVKARSPFNEAEFEKQKPALRGQLLQSLQDPYFQEYLRRKQEEMDKAGKIRIHAKVLDRASMQY